MIEKHELSALAKTMGAAVRSMVEPLVSEVRQLRGEVASLRAAEPPAAGRDGKDADPDMIRSMVAEAVAAIPPPPAGATGPAGEPGRDADTVEILQLMEDSATATKAWATEAIAILTSEMAQAINSAVAGRPGIAGPAGPAGEPGPAGPTGERGRDATPVDEQAVLRAAVDLIRQETTAMFAALQVEIRQSVQTELARLEPVPGPAGPQGPAGRDGEAVPAETVRELVVGQSEQIFAALTVRLSGMVEAAVAAIPAAVPGRDGEPGRPGKDAEPIHPDTVRLMVVDAVRAAIAEIPKPQDGEKGDPGRDALEVEILSAILEGRCYPRGTYAYHCGGIARAVRTTDSRIQGSLISSLGWEVVVDGLHSWNVDQSADQRTFTISAQSTSGRVHCSTFSLPALIYREIYKAGESYERGDVVTSGGSAWHCVAETTKAKPGLSPDWRLMVKEGREGKPGPAGLPGKDGVDGRPGRDLTQITYDGGKH